MFGGVNPAGDVFVNIPYAADPAFNIGNINNRPFADIWGSLQHMDVVNRILQASRAGDYPHDSDRFLAENRAVKQYEDRRRELPPWVTKEYAKKLMGLL